MTESFDPLQNLKDLKVPGQNDRLPGPSIDNIKKEPEPKLSPPEPAVTPRVEREKERPPTPCDRDVKPITVDEPSHTPPLPPRPRSSLPTPPSSAASTYKIFKSNKYLTFKKEITGRGRPLWLYRHRLVLTTRGLRCRLGPQALHPNRESRIMGKHFHPHLISKRRVT